ncbi:MAG: NAD(P)H-dependent oxidoreductase subunit E [Actinomycetota bacterium]
MTDLKTLSDAFVQKAHEIIGRYPVKRSALIMLLHEAQDESGFISDAVIEDVAEVMGLSAADVQQVATFYTMFKRNNPGRFLISVCTNLSCTINGAEETAAALREEIGPQHTATSDGLCSWESVECLATCHWAVAAQVNYLDVPYLTPDRARKLVADLKSGRNLDEILTELRQARSLTEVAPSPERSGGGDGR